MIEEPRAKENEARTPNKPECEDKAADERDSFCVAVSMNTGLVVHTTPALTAVLGYPRDVWIGLSLMDFVHPKDREYFITQVDRTLVLNITT